MKRDIGDILEDLENVQSKLSWSNTLLSSVLERFFAFDELNDNMKKNNFIGNYNTVQDLLNLTDSILSDNAQELNNLIYGLHEAIKEQDFNLATERVVVVA